MRDMRAEANIGRAIAAMFEGGTGQIEILKIDGGFGIVADGSTYEGRLLGDAAELAAHGELGSDWKERGNY